MTEQPEHFLAGMIQQQVEQEMSARMRQEDRISRLYRLIDELSTDHLVTLRIVLSRMNRATANYVEGMVVTELRKTRGVCPECGEPPHETTGARCIVG